MQAQIEQIKKSFHEKLEKLSTSEELEKLRVEYLGKKGEFTQILRSMGSLTAEERPQMGKLVNEAKAELEDKINELKTSLKEKKINEKLKSEIIDISLPGDKTPMGGKHPLMITMENIEQIFLEMGFTIEEGPEVELDYYNFEALNIPKDHPARGEQDTFYINDSVVLRTQTSPVQIRTIEQQKPPIKMISPGKVYRSDDVDATHSPIFYQIEGLVIDKGITFGDLKGTLEQFVKKLYGDNIQTKFRPHHFPFTEPSAEMDGTCFVCNGEGCKVCKGEGWMELLGCGMVHPEVLRKGGIDPEVYSGFAFGFGLDRMTMQKFGIEDIRLLYESDMRFLKQFK